MSSLLSIQTNAHRYTYKTARTLDLRKKGKKLPPIESVASQQRKFVEEFMACRSAFSSIHPLYFQVTRSCRPFFSCPLQQRNSSNAEHLTITAVAAISATLLLYNMYVLTGCSFSDLHTVGYKYTYTHTYIHVHTAYMYLRIYSILMRVVIYIRISL